MQSLRATVTHTDAVCMMTCLLWQAMNMCWQLQVPFIANQHCTNGGTSQREPEQRPLQHTSAELCSGEGSAAKPRSASPRSSGCCSAWSARSRTISSCSPTHAGVFCTASAAQCVGATGKHAKFIHCWKSLGRGLQVRQARRGGGWASAV